MTRVRHLLIWLGLHPDAFRGAVDTAPVDYPVTRRRVWVEAATAVTFTAVLILVGVVVCA